MNYSENNLYILDKKSIRVSNGISYKQLSPVDYPIQEQDPERCRWFFVSLSTLILTDYFGCGVDRIPDIYIKEFSDVLQGYWLNHGRSWEEFKFKICGITISEFMSSMTPLGPIRTLKEAK